MKSNDSYLVAGLADDGVLEVLSTKSKGEPLAF